MSNKIDKSEFYLTLSIEEEFIMIQIIAGLQGAGKTKSLIDLANNETKTTQGHIVYVDADHSHILQLSHKIRLIKTDEYPLDTPAEFFGFVCGYSLSGL